jgi:hypothetical protein
MKNSILPLLLMIASSLFAQNKIEGFGKFKIQKTTISYLDTIVKEQKLDKVKMTSFDDYMKLRYKKDKIAEVFSDTINRYNSPPYAHSCPNARVFYIPKIAIADITFSDTYLTFFNEILVDIKTDYTSEIVEALELKYGKPAIDKKEKEVQCTLKLTGSNLTYTETMYYQKWENGEIECTAAIGDYRDSKCEKKTLSYIIIGLSDKKKEIVECDIAVNERVENKQKNEKKKQLSDF